MFKIVIPSFNRSKEILKLTLKWIFKYEINKYIEIFIFVCNEDQDIEGYKAIEKKNVNIKLVFGYLGLVNQRNYIKDYFIDNEKLLILDDDIKALVINDNNNINTQLIIDSCNETFDYMVNNGLFICGINPTSNLYFNKQELKKGLYFCVGCCYFEINNKHKLLYHTELTQLKDEKEDYIRTLNHYKYNCSVGRNDKLTIKHKFNGTRGGMNGETVDDLKTRQCINNLSINLLLGIYPNFLNTRKKLKNDELMFFNKVFYKKVIKKKIESVPAEYYGSDFEMLPNDKNFILIDEETNKPVAYIIRNILNLSIIDDELMKKIDSWCNYDNSNRGDIAGKIDKLKLSSSFKNQDLTNVKLSSTGSRVYTKKGFQYSNKVNCITLGYYTKDKISQYDKKKHTLIAKGLVYLMDQLNNIYKHIYLDNLDINDSKPSKTNYLNSYFTSITINKGLRSANHKDKNNRNYWALMFIHKYINNGCFNGANICLTDYKLNLNLNFSKDVLIFDSKNLHHCNSEFNKEDQKESRFSFIFFSK
jgi:hypothetical protein